MVTDSTADLTADQLAEYNITRIPLEVTVDGEDYRDWVDLGPDQFLDKLESADQIPTTSQPPVGRFIEQYQKLATEYDAIISLHLSKELSGTVNTAQLAANQIDEIPIKVVDSELVTIPLGLLTIETAKKTKQGYILEEIIEFIDQVQDRIEIYFTVDTLDYLEKNGRIGKATSFLGNLFNIRPLLTLEDGEVTPWQKVRGEKRLYSKFKQVTDDTLNNKTGSKLIILYAKYRAKADQLKEVLTDEFSWKEVKVAKLGPVISSHIGPTPFGAIIYK